MIVKKLSQQIKIWMISLLGFLKDFEHKTLCLWQLQITWKIFLLFHPTPFQKDVNTDQRPRRKQPRPLRTKDEHWREGGWFSQEGGCRRTLWRVGQGMGLGMEVWKPMKKAPSLTTHQSCTRKHSSLIMSHKCLILHVVLEYHTLSKNRTLEAHLLGIPYIPSFQLQYSTHKFLLISTKKLWILPNYFLTKEPAWAMSNWKLYLKKK